MESRLSGPLGPVVSTNERARSYEFHWEAFTLDFLMIVAAFTVFWQCGSLRRNLQISMPQLHTFVAIIAVSIGTYVTVTRSAYYPNSYLELSTQTLPSPIALGNFLCVGAFAVFAVISMVKGIFQAYQRYSKR
jgi:hypothetical protein